MIGGPGPPDKPGASRAKPGWAGLTTIGSRLGTLVPWRAMAPGDFTGPMFASREIVLEVSFPAAQAGLGRLTDGCWLEDASRMAYAEGLAGLPRAGPFGDAFGASKLVRVSLLEPMPRKDLVILALRWEATGVSGRAFPVLDANLELSPASETSSRLVLTGAYRPPLGALGFDLDRAVLQQVASTTVYALLRRIGEAIAGAQHGNGQTPVTVSPAEHDQGSGQAC